MGININPLNAELNPMCHFLALLGAHHILHFSKVGVKIVRSNLQRKASKLIDLVYRQGPRVDLREQGNQTSG